MKILIIHMAIYFSLYILGAYATTDILRLTSLSILSIDNPSCYCPKCGRKIYLRDQLPVISYCICRGKCRFCKEKIPFSDIFFELFIFLFLSFVVTIFDFCWGGYFFCIIFYETLKIVYILIFGKKVKYFLYNLMASLKNNVMIFSLLFILFFMEHIIL